MGPETVFMFIEFQESIVVGLWRWVEAGTDKVRNVAFEERSCGAFGTRISGLEGGVDFRKADGAVNGVLVAIGNDDGDVLSSARSGMLKRMATTRLFLSQAALHYLRCHHISTTCIRDRTVWMPTYRGTCSSLHTRNLALHYHGTYIHVL